MQIKIKDDGKIIIDGSGKELKDFSVDFLDEVVECAIKDDLTLDIDNNAQPIAQFFNQILEGSKEGSVLRNRLVTIAQEKESTQALLKDIGETYKD